MILLSCGIVRQTLPLRGIILTTDLLCWVIKTGTGHVVVRELSKPAAVRGKPDGGQGIETPSFIEVVQLMSRPLTIQVMPCKAPKNERHFQLFVKDLTGRPFTIYARPSEMIEGIKVGSVTGRTRGLFC